MASGWLHLGWALKVGRNWDGDETEEGTSGQRHGVTNGEDSDELGRYWPGPG